MNMNELKAKVVAKTGQTEQEVQELIDNQVIKDCKARFPTLTGEEFESRCVQAGTQFFRKFINTPSDLVHAVVLLDGGVQWRNRSKINTALKSAEDPMVKMQMIASGELAEVGGKLFPLDTKEAYPNGDKNPNHGKPLVESRFRIVDGRFVLS